MCGRVRERADQCPLPHARSLVQDVLLRPITTPYLRLDATVLPSSQRDTLPALPDLASRLAPRPFRSEAQPSVPAGNCGHRSLDLRRRPRDPRRRTHRTRRPWITLVPRGSTTRPPSLPESQVLKPWAKPCAFLAIPDANWSTHGTHERRRSRGPWLSLASSASAAAPQGRQSARALASSATVRSHGAQGHGAAVVSPRGRDLRGTLRNMNPNGSIGGGAGGSNCGAALRIAHRRLATVWPSSRRAPALISSISTH